MDKTETTTAEQEALAVADALRALIASGRVIAHPAKLLELAKRLEAAAL